MNTNRQQRVLNVEENKVLKLHKVLRKDLSETEASNLSQTLQSFQAYIKARGLTARGPLITYTKTEVVDGNATLKTAIMSQVEAKPNTSVAYPYSYTEELRVPNCLYVRYNDNQDYLQIAYNKIGVYAFENYLNLTCSTYSIHLANGQTYMCDIFAEVIKDGE